MGLSIQPFSIGPRACVDFGERSPSDRAGPGTPSQETGDPGDFQLISLTFPEEVETDVKTQWQKQGQQKETWLQLGGSRSQPEDTLLPVECLFFGPIPVERYFLLHSQN